METQQDNRKNSSHVVSISDVYFQDSIIKDILMLELNTEQFFHQYITYNQAHEMS